MKLGVNIDHVASLRQLRKSTEPEPVTAAAMCELAGADSIVAHLREDRRHINERDVSYLRAMVKTRFNLEMSINKEIVEIACKLAPDQVTLVPEKRQELTTEGGLDVIALRLRLKEIIKKFHGENIPVSLFVEPEKGHIRIAKQVKADFVELHTGAYANCKDEKALRWELAKITDAARYAKNIGIRVNAGHGLDYRNTAAICKIKEIEELNIGYSIICRSLFTGLEEAVRQMRLLIDRNSL